VDAAFARAQTGADWLRDPKSGKGYHPGVTVALADAFGPVTTYGGYWVMRKAGAGWDQVDLRGRPLKVPPHLPADFDTAQLRPFL
jgi:hypothetical protein